MSGQPVFSTNCRARNGQNDCSNARSKKLTQQSKVIKKALNYKVYKKINYLVGGGTVQIFSGKLGVRNAGFRFRKTDWRGLVIE